jgi:very-short-patch-repair endonuclease
LTSSAISRWVLAGRLHRRYHGVYTLGHTALSREGEFLAATFACGNGSLLTCFALLELLRLQRGRATRIDVLVPRNRAAPEGIRVHRTRTIHPRDRSTFKGIPVTSIPRLLVELSAVQHPLELANVMHEAEFRGRLSLPAVRDAIDRSAGRHHLSVLEQAIAYHLHGSVGFKSGNEKHYFRLLEQSGLPEPLVNVQFHGLEVDFRWPDRRCAVEIDGHPHQRARTKREDAAVNLALAAAGYRVMRFTEDDLQLRPEWVVDASRTFLRVR